MRDTLLSEGERFLESIASTKKQRLVRCVTSNNGRIEPYLTALKLCLGRFIIPRLRQRHPLWETGGYTYFMPSGISTLYQNKKSLHSTLIDKIPKFFLMPNLVLTDIKK